MEWPFARRFEGNLIEVRFVSGEELLEVNRTIRNNEACKVENPLKLDSKQNRFLNKTHANSNSPK